MAAKYGKPSIAELSVVPIVPGEARPAPPSDMVAREADAWRSIVNAMPSGWFGRETWPVLRGLCKHIRLAEALAAKIDWALENNIPMADLDLMLAAHKRETAAIRSHSADLRLTKVAQIKNSISADRAKRNQPRARLWEE